MRDSLNRLATADINIGDDCGGGRFGCCLIGHRALCIEGSTRFEEDHNGGSAFGGETAPVEYRIGDADLARVRVAVLQSHRLAPDLSLGQSRSRRDELRVRRLNRIPQTRAQSLDLSRPRAIAERGEPRHGKCSPHAHKGYDDDNFD